MTLPDDKRKGSPRERFRNILSADEEDQQAREPRKPAVVNLPRVGESGGQPTSTAPAPHVPVSPGSDNVHGPRLLRTFWTVGAILSVIANLVLLSMLTAGRGFSASGATAGVLPGIYASLEQMDDAHIRTTVPVQTSITLDTTVPTSASTQITLSRDLFVRGAHVTINSSGLSIDSPADITLPAGTIMEVSLDLALPLQAAVPVSAEVPVDIAMRDTELHAAIQALKDALRPLVCASAPGITSSDGTPICR